MEKEKEYLIRYIDYLEKNGMNVNSSDMEASYYVENAPELRSIASAIKNTSSKEARLRLVDRFIEEKLFEKKSAEEKLKAALEKRFGIDLTDIDHMKLQSGIDIIAFYDSRIGRKRLVDYSYAKSLVSEFTNIQNNSIDFQTEDEKANSNEIAEQEANQNKNKRELDMIDIERFKAEYDELIKRVPNADPKKIQSINELIREADKKNIKYINIENMVALDSKNNIIESHYNEKKGEVELSTPESYKPSVEKVNNEAQVDQAISNVENGEANPENNNVENNPSQVDVAPTEFEKKEEEVSAQEIDLDNEIERCKINGDKTEIFKNIVRYSANMEELDKDYSKGKISEDEKEFYELMCKKYQEALKKKKTMTKALTYNPAADSRGIISITLASLFVMGLGFLMALLIS